MIDHPPTAGRARRGRAAAAAVAAGLTAVALTVLPAAAAGADPDPGPGPAPAAPRLLVGMGDSYSTGAGIPPADPSAGQCHRSLAAYPMLTAQELGFTGRSVACGGAQLADLTTSTRPGVPPQITGIADADVVAVTIGGNDLGGPGGVLQSAENSASMGSFAAAVHALGPQLVAGYTAIRRAAPRAELYVLGYPDIVPDTQAGLEACLGAQAYGLDAAGIHANIALLNTAVAGAAASTGAVFVPTAPAFAGHEMCTERAYANAPRDWLADSPGGGLHPNALGHLAMAADLADAIAGVDPPATSPVDPPAGPPAVGPPAVGPPSVPAPPWTAAERAAARAAGAALRQQLTDRLGPLLQPGRGARWGVW